MWNCTPGKSESAPAIRADTAEPRLSVGIVNTNNWPLLRRCLQSLYQEPPQVPFEVLLVDNASTDGSGAMVEAEFPAVKLIVNRERRWLAANENQLLQQARGEFLLLLNEDTELVSGALDRLVKALQNHPDVGLATCRLLNPDGSLQTSYYGMYPSLSAAALDAVLLPALFRRARNLWVQWWPERAQAIRSCRRLRTACAILRRAAAIQAGLFDEEFAGAEDADYCYRLRRAGWKLAYLPEVLAIHYDHATWGKLGPRALLADFQGWCRFAQKHYKAGRLYLAALRVFLIAGAFIRAVVSLFLLSLSSRRSHLRQRVRDYRQFFPPALRLLLEQDSAAVAASGP